MALADWQRQPDAASGGVEASFWPRSRLSRSPALAPGGVDVEALLLLGLSVATRGHTARAAAILDRVARERPDEAHPCTDLAALLPRLTPAEIATQYRACLRFAPEDMRLRQAFAGFLQASGDTAEAVAVLREGLRQDPSSAAAQHAMGIALAELVHIPEAIWHLEQAVGINPAFAAGWAGLGLLLRVEGRFDSALAAYEQAIACAPADARIRVSRAQALLQAGRWTEGWPDFEWRLRLPGNARVPLERLLPPLAAVGNLAGRTVVLIHEEGFGDTLQCLRYVPMLQAHGARVVAWVPASLERLVRTVPGVAEVVTANGMFSPHDLHCPFLSLPRVFATTIGNIPRGPYLQADPALAAAWERRLPPAGKLRVGLVWAGREDAPSASAVATLDRRRHAGLAAFAPLGTVPGVSLVSLQKGAAAGHVRTPPAGMSLFDPMHAVQDFSDTAAIIANLDVVVSVDTAVAHLAGAMGKPVFLLDRYDNCWRWLAGRADSPWYPSMTIFRQERLGDWTAPMLRAAAALAALATFRGVTADAAAARRTP